MQLPLLNVNKEVKNSLNLEVAPSRNLFLHAGVVFFSYYIFNYCLFVEYISQDGDIGAT